MDLFDLKEELERQDIDKLINIGIKQGYKINKEMVDNFYSNLPSKLKDQDKYEMLMSIIIQSGVEILNNTIDVENEEGEVLTSIVPFDTSRINITSDKITIDSLIKRLENNEVNLSTSFQRKAGLWNQIQKSQLIESILLKLPLPAFYFDSTNDGDWLIIDGLQRITTLNEFIIKKNLVLKGLEYFKDLNGVSFDDLPRPFVRTIEETNLFIYKILPSTPENVKFNIFKRINTGGLELEAQEIRHALYQGKATVFLKQASDSKAFLIATAGSVNPSRMLDCEFILRYISVCVYGVENYTSSADNFLNETMIYMNSLSDDSLNKILVDFEDVMNFSYKIFERHTFRRIGYHDDRRRPINKAIFEIFSKIFFEMDNFEKERIIEKKEMLMDEFSHLCEFDKDFNSYLKSSDKFNFNRRFITVQEKIIKVVLLDD